jgi:hypothetical protein
MIMIMAMAGITMDITITTTVTLNRLARFRGDAWAGLRCWWRSPSRQRAWCKYDPGRQR